MLIAVFNFDVAGNGSSAKCKGHKDEKKAWGNSCNCCGGEWKGQSTGSKIGGDDFGVA